MKVTFLTLDAMKSEDKFISSSKSSRKSNNNEETNYLYSNARTKLHKTYEKISVLV